LIDNSMYCMYIAYNAVQEQDYVSAYGSLLAEVGKAEEALAVLDNGVQRFPDVGFEKYMSALFAATPCTPQTGTNKHLKAEYGL